MLVEMYIDKFDKVVKIDDEHPLAIAQKAKGGSSKPADKPPAGDKPNYSKLTKAELLDFCEKRKVTVDDDATKAEIIAALEAKE